MSRTSRPRTVAVFATQGSGSRDEERIVSLTSALDPSVWPFDRGAKLRSALRLLSRSRRERPGLVVMEGTGLAGGLAMLLARIAFGTRFVVSSGDAVGPFFALRSRALGPPGRVYERALCRCCAGYIGWTPYLSGRAITLGARRAMTAAGWAPAQNFATDRNGVRDELGIAHAAIVFGLVGSLNWTTRVGYCYGLELVRAISSTTRDDVHVILVGDGDGRPRLEGEAGIDLGARVHLIGQVPREHLGRYLAAIDVASLPQSVDGVGAFRYSTKLSEYLAAGLPVVTGQLPFAYDLGGDWLWRLPGDAPWDRRYVDALAALMTAVSPDDIAARRKCLPAEPAVFDRQLQEDRVSAFLTDLLAPP